MTWKSAHNHLQSTIKIRHFHMFFLLDAKFVIIVTQTYSTNSLEYCFSLTIYTSLDSNSTQERERERETELNSSQFREQEWKTTFFIIDIALQLVDFLHFIELSKRVSKSNKKNKSTYKSRTICCFYSIKRNLSPMNQSTIITEKKRI